MGVGAFDAFAADEVDGDELPLATLVDGVFCVDFDVAGDFTKQLNSVLLLEFKLRFDILSTLFLENAIYQMFFSEACRDVCAAQKNRESEARNSAKI